MVVRRREAFDRAAKYATFRVVGDKMVTSSGIVAKL
jgi:hypothetical protein